MSFLTLILSERMLHLKSVQTLVCPKGPEIIILICTEEGTGSMSIENNSYFLISYGIRIVIKYVLGNFVLPCVVASFPPLF